MKNGAQPTTQTTNDQINYIADKLLEHDDMLQWLKENAAVKSDIRTLDVLLKLAQKKDQELTFMGENIKRVKEKTEKNTQDIQTIKPALGLS